MKIDKKIRGVLRYSPSLFDLLLCSLILLIAYWNDDFIRRLLFNFGTMFILCATLSMRERRRFKSVPLSLILVWAFAGIFIHSWNSDIIAGHSIASRHLSIFLLAEGFIYLFSGVMLITLIVRYVKSRVFCYSMVLISMIPFLKKVIFHGRMSLLLALVLSILIYGFFNGRRFVSFAISAIGSVIIISNWKWVMMKWSFRPYIWIELVRKMIQHPFVGVGNSHGLFKPNLFWVRTPPQWFLDHGLGKVEQGWLLMHNDYLRSGVQYGAIITVLLLIFVIISFNKIKHHPLSILFLTVAITPFFQCSMFWTYKACLYIIIGGLALSAGYEET